MKLAHYQFERHLQAKKLAPIYLFSGDEPFLKQEASAQLRQAASLAGFSETIRLHAESGFDWEGFYSTAYAVSLFAPRRLIELELGETTVPAAGSKILQKYGEAPPAETILLLRMSKTDSKIEKSAWFKALDKHGMTVALWPPAREALPQWILQRAKQQPLSLSKEAAAFLAENVEGNLLAATQALEKLALLKISGEISPAIIAEILVDSAQFTIFDFVESLLQEDKSRALRIIDKLQHDDVEPVLVLWAVTREFRLMAELARQLKHGVAFKTLCQQHRIWEKRQPIVQRFLQKNSVEQCWQKLLHAAEIDRIIKGAVPGEAWQGIIEKMV